MTQIKEPSGVLVIRAWVDGSLPSGLRARIVFISVPDGNQMETVAASLDQILVIVRGWLEYLLAEAQFQQAPTDPQSGPS